MKYELEGTIYDVIVNKKNNKNLYIRVKEDGNIYVTCNYFTSNRAIKKILDENIDGLKKMLNHVEKKRSKNNQFLYLGRSYKIIFDDSLNQTKMIDDKIFAKSEKELNKWYKEEIIRIFDDRFVYVFNKFKENIKSPILKIRTMSSRWGVYNRKNHTITLNSKLIEFDLEKIDYVIIHELSHIIHFNHSKDFWSLVGKYCKNYKDIRKAMKD